MSQNIKGLLARFTSNLRKTWLLGAICVIAAVAFIMLFETTNDSNPIMSESSSPLGAQSVSKINWAFDNDEIDGEAFLTNVNNAKETLEVVKRLSESANFYLKINEALVQNSLSTLGENDYFMISTSSYNIIEILVVSSAADRVECLEKIIRTEINAILKDSYNIASWDIISEPRVFVAINTGMDYVLSKQAYLPQDSNSEDVLDGGVAKTSIFTFSNIIIIASAVALWLAIVVLLTIADDHIYSINDIQKKDLLCYGELKNNLDSEILSIICKKTEYEKGFHVLCLSNTGEMLNNQIADEVKDKYNMTMEISSWKEHAVDHIKKNEKVLLAVKQGQIKETEIDNCLKMIDSVGIDCIGCILY